MGAGKIDNIQINRAWRSKFCRAIDMVSVVTATPALANSGTGGPVLTDIGNGAGVGLLIAAGNTVVSGFFADLDDVDWSIQPQFTLLFASAHATPTGTITPTLTYSVGKPKSALTGTSTFPQTPGAPQALAFDAVSFSAQYKHSLSVGKQMAKADCVAMNVNCAVELAFGITTIVTAGLVAPLYFMGTKFNYVPLIGAKSSNNAPGQTKPLGL